MCAPPSIIVGGLPPSRDLATPTATEMACGPGACQDGQLPRARAASLDRSRQSHGGYDCEFVSPPPEAIQAECPVCLSILKEPCLISCPCGQKICRECVELIKNDKKPCPLCNKTEFTFL